MLVFLDQSCHKKIPSPFKFHQNLTELQFEQVLLSSNVVQPCIAALNLVTHTASVVFINDRINM